MQKVQQASHIQGGSRVTLWPAGCKKTFYLQSECKCQTAKCNCQLPASSVSICLSVVRQHAAHRCNFIIIIIVVVSAIRFDHHWFKCSARGACNCVALLSGSCHSEECLKLNTSKTVQNQRKNKEKLYTNWFSLYHFFFLAKWSRITLAVSEERWERTDWDYLVYRK